MMQAQPPGTGKRVQSAGLGQVPAHDPNPPTARHGPGTQVHAPVPGSGTQSSNTDGHSPAHAPCPSGPHSGGKRLVLVVDVDEVVVVGTMQPGAPHASQQLGTDPVHALPPLGATQRAALCLIVH